MLPLVGALIFLVLVDPAFIRPQSDDPLSLPLQGNAIRRAVLGSFYALAAYGLWAKRIKVRDVLARQGPLLGLASYALASVLWSTSPSLTLVRAGHFLGLLILAWCAFTRERDVRRGLDFLRLLFVVAMVASLAWIVVFPDVAIHAEGGEWAGIYRHKSDLGSVAVFTFALWLPFASRETAPWQRLLTLGVLGLASVLLVRSDSVTEWMGAALVVVLWLGMRLPLPVEWKLAGAPILPLLAAFWFWNFQALDLDAFLQRHLGRNLTFTGRTPLWDAILENIRLHPWLGEGYDAFWIAGNQRAEYLIQSVGWDAYTAHNGYLEVLNTLGIVGLVGLLATAAQALAHAFEASRRDAAVGTALLLSLVWLLFSSLTKSVFCAGTSLGWVMYLVLCVMAAEAARTRPAADDPKHPQGKPEAPNFSI